MRDLNRKLDDLQSRLKLAEDVVSAAREAVEALKYTQASVEIKEVCKLAWSIRAYDEGVKP
jgi:hypothetical protein